MLDLLLGIFFAFLLVRGWARGFVKEAMDLVGMLVGLAVAFRLSSAAGSVVGGILGSSPAISRVIGGLALFAIVGGGAAVLAHYLHKVARLPGLALSNRLTGAGLAVAWGAFLATLALSVLSLFRLPEAIADQLDESAVATRLTDPTGVPQAMFSRVSGDKVLGVLLGLDDLTDGRRAIVKGEDVVSFSPAAAGELALRRESAISLFERVNDDRADGGLAPLEWSNSLALVAVSHARDMYTAGFFSHRSPTTGLVSDRLAAAGVRVSVAGENLALAADVVEAHRGLVTSESHLANMREPAYGSVGITAMEGPLGLMVVQVFSD